MSDMTSQDHDLLITLSTKLEAHSQRESEVSRATLAEVAKLGAKMDAITTAHAEQSRDIRDIKARQRDDDLRIATLAQQVDSLQDAAEQAEKVTKALAAESEKRAKRYAWIAVISSPIVGIVVPLLLKWIAGLIVGTP
jgi:hypothetical protein